MKIRRPGQRTAIVTTGVVASTGVVIGLVGAGPPTTVVVPEGPAGLWNPAASGRTWFAVLAAVSVLVLAVTFVVLHRRAGAGRLGMRTVCTAAVMWALPVLPAPPLLSLDAYSYVAQGTMLLTGLDPYASGPDRLGGPLVASVAPVWRATPAPYGPLSLGLLRMVVDWSGGSAAASVFLLRVLAVVAVAGAALVAVQLATRAHAALGTAAPPEYGAAARRAPEHATQPTREPADPPERAAASLPPHGARAAVPDRAPTAVPPGAPAAVPDRAPTAVPPGAPTAVPPGTANPPTPGAAETPAETPADPPDCGAHRARAVAAALVAANPLVLLHLIGGVHLDVLLMALAALTVFAARHRVWVVAGLAAAVAFAVKATGAVLIAYVLAARARGAGVLSRRTAGTGLLMAAAVVALSALIPNGWGWLGAMDTPGLIRHPYDPATLLGWVLHGAGALTPWTPDLTSSVSAARVVLLVGGAALVARLLRRAGRPASVGTALQVTALCAPTVHAWYLTWGLPMIGAAGRRTQQWTVAVSVALCFTALPDQVSRRPAGIALTVTLLAVALAVVALPATRGWWIVGRTAQGKRLPRVPEGGTA